MKSRSYQRGFTLFEVLIAISMMGIAMAFIGRIFAQQGRFSTESEVKSLAQNVVDRRLDQIRLLDPTTLPTSGTDSVQLSAGGRLFTVATQYCKTVSFCSTNTRGVSVTAQYRGRTYYDTETIFTQLR